MLVHELKQRFEKHKNYAAEDLNELLDFAKRTYIYNEITLKDYKIIVRELESQGATPPADKYQGNFLIEKS